MRVYINDKLFTEIPGSCGTCPFFCNGATCLDSGAEKGHCILFDEWHKRWREPPSRCKKLFRKAEKFPDGEKFVIIANLKNNENDSDT